MIRKILFVLFLVVLLCAASDWKRFKERARPALQPLIDWTQREVASEPAETRLPSGPEFKASDNVAGVRLPRVSEPRSDSGSGSSSPPNNLPPNRDDPQGQRFATVDLALQRAQREADQAERAIRQLEQATKIELERLNRATLSWSERRKRAATIETESRREKSTLEAKRDLWRRETERIQAMRNRLAEVNR